MALGTESPPCPDADTFDPPAPGQIAPPRGWAGRRLRFLPPAMIVLTGVGFLAFRDLSRDWCGVVELLERASVTWRTSSSRNDPIPALAIRTEVPEPEVPAAQPSPLVPANPQPRAEGDDEIAREAERTRQRIAELERMKDEEARKLAATEEQRREVERRSPQRRLVLPPAEIDRLLVAQRAHLRRQLLERQRQQQAWADEMHQRHREQLEQFRRRFSSDPGLGLAAAPPLLASPLPRDLESRIPTLPTPGGGITTFREFRGNGLSSFEFRWKSGPTERPD